MGTDEKADGFEFAIMLLATLGTIIYTAYTYFQSRATDPISYAFFVAMITALIALSILLIIYIFVKGYSMECQDEKRREFKRYASYIYSITFDVGAMLLLLIVGAFFFILIGSPSIFLLYILLILLSYYFYRELKSYFQNKSYIIFFKKLKSYLKNPISDDQKKRIFVLLITLVILILWTQIYVGMLDLFQGDAKIEMNNIYYKNGEPIPISIEILGRDPGVSIYLYNATSEINNITLKPKDVLNKVEVGEYLVGNAYASGKYYVFINTTNMSEGYYRLVYLLSMEGRSIDGYKYGKSFYLLNQSEKDQSEK